MIIWPGRLWIVDEEDGFYYDVLIAARRQPSADPHPPGVGYINVVRGGSYGAKIVDRLPGFQRRMEWFLNNNANLRNHIDEQRLPDGSVRRLLSVVSLQRLPRMMRYLLDEDEFPSPMDFARYHAITASIPTDCRSMVRAGRGL